MVFGKPGTGHMEGLGQGYILKPHDTLFDGVGIQLDWFSPLGDPNSRDCPLSSTCPWSPSHLLSMEHVLGRRRCICTRDRGSVLVSVPLDRYPLRRGLLKSRRWTSTLQTPRVSGTGLLCHLPRPEGLLCLRYVLRQPNFTDVHNVHVERH